MLIQGQCYTLLFRNVLSDKKNLVELSKHLPNLVYLFLIDVRAVSNSPMNVSCNYGTNLPRFNALIAVRRRRQGFGPSTAGGGRVGAARSNSMTTCSVLAELGQVRKVGVRIKR